MYADTNRRAGVRRLSVAVWIHCSSKFNHLATLVSASICYPTLLPDRVNSFHFWIR